MHIIQGCLFSDAPKKVFVFVSTISVLHVRSAIREEFTVIGRGRMPGCSRARIVMMTVLTLCRTSVGKQAIPVYGATASSL